MNKLKFTILVVQMMIVTNCLPENWVNPRQKDVQTIYFQGIFASQAQIAKYTGSRGFVATTGEHVRCCRAPDLILQPFVGKELDEVDLKCVFQKNRFEDMCLAYLKCVGAPAYSIQKMISDSRNNKWGISTEPPLSKETVKSFSINWKKCDLGQNGDIAEHKRRYEICMQEHPDSDVILYGASRGAATTFNAAALNKYDTSRIKLVVLESCYDSIPSILRAWYPRMCSQVKICFFIQKILSFCTGYRYDGVSPEKVIDSFPSEVPVVFITSKVDTIVPHRCTTHIAQMLAERGKNAVYLLELQYSPHPEYAIYNDEDKELYQCFMHTLYKKFNLPHIPDLAVDECLLEKYKLQ